MRFLMALDKSNNSLRAVKFVADAINPCCDLTLMSIVPDMTAACELREPDEVHPLLKENIKDFCLIEDAQTAAMEGFLDEAKKLLVSCGFLPDKITVCIRKQQTDIAGDILVEARGGRLRRHHCGPTGHFSCQTVHVRQRLQQNSLSRGKGCHCGRLI